MPDTYPSTRQAQINSMAIATLLDMIENIKVGREVVECFDVKNEIESLRHPLTDKEELHHRGRTITVILQ